MKLASHTNNEFLFYYHQLKDSLNDHLSQTSYKIKLIVIDINVIMYHNNIQTFSLNLNLKDLRKAFGGYDRIQRITDFFQQLSLCGVDIILLSKEQNHEKISLILHKLNLLKYVQLYKFNNCYFSNNINKKIFNLIKIKDKFKLKYHDEVLFISDCIDNIGILNNECKLYLVDNHGSKPLFGITIFDMVKIKHIVKDEDINLNMNDDTYIHGSNSLSDINRKLLIDLMKEIIKKSHKSQSKKQIHVINYIYTKLDENPEYIKFIKFGVCLQKAIKSVSNHDYWVAAQYLQQTLQYDESQLYIYRLLAKCYSCLRHVEEAEIIYQKALNISPLDYLTNFSFAYHKLSIGEPLQALHHFEYTTKLSNRSKLDKSMLTALARTYECTGNFEKADEYFKKATNSNGHIYEHAHFHYAMFLNKFDRYIEAQQQLKICLKISPNKWKYNQQMNVILFELNISKKKDIYFNQYVHYIKNQINENHINNIQCSIDEFIKQYIFDEFWFDHMDKLTHIFNKYYDTFILNNLNDIQTLLNGDLHHILKYKIKITNNNDLESIVIALLKYKKYILSIVNEFMFN